MSCSGSVEATAARDLGSVGERDLDARRALDHVQRGEDRALRVHDHPPTEVGLAALGRRVVDACTSTSEGRIAR